MKKLDIDQIDRINESLQFAISSLRILKTLAANDMLNSEDIVPMLHEVGEKIEGVNKIFSEIPREGR